jgi:hypothetical protein
MVGRNLPRSWALLCLTALVAASSCVRAMSPTGQQHATQPDGRVDSIQRDSLRRDAWRPDGTASSIAFVQSGAADNGCWSGTLPTVTVPLNAPVTAHGTIIVALDFLQAAADVTLKGVTDSLGNTYTVNVPPGPVVAGNEGPYLTAIASASDVKGGNDIVTVALSKPTACIEVYVLEYSGLARSAAFDVGRSAGGTTTATDGMASGIANTTAADELIFGFGFTNEAATAGTGFTPRNKFHGNVTEDRMVSAVGSFQTTATMYPKGTSWVMMMATFRGE